MCAYVPAMSQSLVDVGHSRRPTITTINCNQVLLDLWRHGLPGEPSELTEQWWRQHPNDDLEHVVEPSCDGYHHSECYAAIHLFQCDGARYLVEENDP